MKLYTLKYSQGKGMAAVMCREKGERKRVIGRKGENERISIVSKQREIKRF